MVWRREIMTKRCANSFLSFYLDQNLNFFEEVGDIFFKKPIVPQKPKKIKHIYRQ